MNKVFILCSSVFLFWAFARGNADEHFPFLGETAKDAVHVRAGANTNFESLYKLGKGSQVMVTGRHYEWYAVQLPAAAGVYVRADYIKENGNNVGEITGDKVNIRAKANSDSSSLGQLERGELVKLIEQARLPDGQANGWWKIEPPLAAQGWVHADLIQMRSAQVPADAVSK